MQKKAWKTMGYVTFMVAFILAWLVLLAGPAGAADSARLEELERKIEEQQKMLEELKGQMQALKQENQETADEVKKTAKLANDLDVEVFGKALVTSDDPKFRVKLSGQVNRQVMYADDGHRGKVYQTDSDQFPTLINVVAEGDVSDDLTVGGRIESAYQENRPVKTSQNNENSGFDFNNRYAEIYLDSKRFGKLQVGKGFASSFTLYEIDFSGTQPISLITVGNLFGGIQFWNRDANEFSGIPVAGVFLDVENASLVNRVRYDSPELAGFQLSGSSGSDQRWDATLRWKEELGNFEFSGATAYQENTLAASDWRLDGGLGILHKPSGLNLVGGGAVFEKKDGRNGRGWVVKPGWRRKLFSFGETKFSADISRQFDTITNQENAISYGAFCLQDVDNWNMGIYAGYRYYDYDRSDFDTSPIHVPVVGAIKYF
jgi:predicted porin/cell division protein FtsB